MNLDNSEMERFLSFYGRYGKPLTLRMAKAAHVAQSVERILGKDEVTSSILVVGSKFAKQIWS